MIPVPTPGQNPFSTCWIRPTSCSYRFPVGESLHEWVRQLELAGGGQLVGPHGAGKSTLLASIVGHLKGKGEQVQLLQLCSGMRRLPAGVRPFRLPQNGWLAIDGFEQLSFWSRWRLLHGWRRQKYRLLVTTHRRCKGAFAIQLAPDLAMAQDVVRSLQRSGPRHVTPADVEQLVKVYGANLRELLFECYDIHQRRDRTAKS